MRDRATRGGEEHTQRFDAPTARGSSRTSTSTPNQPAVATTRQETTSHAETAEEIGHYGQHSRGARLWASASWYCIVTCCANTALCKTVEDFGSRRYVRSLRPKRPLHAKYRQGCAQRGDAGRLLATHAR